ncbi:MAG: FMN-binding protein, partial [Lachnospiraceae bacterium]|nr:FMN-binding protein [Lachnospiraceae bacterium]
MTTMIKNMLIIFAITLVSGLLLGGVYLLTKDTIAAADAEAVIAAYKQVFPDAVEFEEETLDGALAAQVLAEGGYSDTGILNLQLAYDEQRSFMGCVFTVVSHNGYGGDIVMTVGIRNGGTINGIAFLEISETVGLGMKAEELLAPQFTDKRLTNFELT